MQYQWQIIVRWPFHQKDASNEEIFLGKHAFMSQFYDFPMNVLRRFCGLPDREWQMNTQKMTKH